MTRHFQGRILCVMTMADLSPDNLAVLEAKLCSVPLLDWTGDKLTELIQDQAHIHPAQKLCEGAAQVCAGLVERSETRPQRSRNRASARSPPPPPCHRSPSTWKSLP